MKILFTSNNSELGGGETSLLRLISSLKESNEITLLTVENGELCERARELNIPVVIDNYKRKNVLKTLFRLRSTLRSADSIHSNECSAALLFGMLSRIATFRKIPNYWTCHGQWYQFSKLKVWGIKILISSVFCVSENVFYHLDKYGIRNKILSRLGIDFSENSHDTDDFDLRKEFGISNESLLITTIARFEPIKGQLKAIKAIERLVLSGYDVSYVIVGGYFKVHDSAREYFEKSANYIKNSSASEKIYLAGERSDVSDIIKSSDLILVPSDRESLSMVTIEAIKEKTPIISTPCQGPEEILEDFKYQICDDNSTNGIYKILERYCSDKLFRKLIDNSVDAVFESVKKKYDINVVAKTYEEVFMNKNEAL